MSLTRFSIRTAIACASLASVIACGDAGRVAITPEDQQADRVAVAALSSVDGRDLCGPAEAGHARCHAKAVASGAVAAAAAPIGLVPDDLRDAYTLPSSGGNGRVVAVVDAFDAPNAEADLQVYREQFGLPPCTSANGCFTKVNQDGQSSPLPKADAGWSGEIALDLDMVSATCPDCRLLLVEARSTDLADLGAGVATAARLGASAISNSYGAPEGDIVPIASDRWYDQPGVLITASSGDGGGAVTFPASGEHVLAVGGTSLVRSASSRGWAESAWRNGGSGCSGYTAKPSFQIDPGCDHRAVVDVAAVADPATGVAVYHGGWRLLGGTSASAPIVAGIFTLLDLADVANDWVYGHTSSFFDVTHGTSGATCDGGYLCAAVDGYDGPTGWGTPNGAVLTDNAALKVSSRGESSTIANASTAASTGGGCSVSNAKRGSSTWPAGAAIVAMLACVTVERRRRGRR